MTTYAQRGNMALKIIIVYLIAGSFVDGSCGNECVIQVEENGINPLQVVVTLIALLQWERRR